jgi:2-oxoglutarate ferredoxin oxidoreductase subunit beta
LVLETIQALELERRTIGVFGHGCSALMITNLDVDMNLSLHGRAPATATGIKRMRPDRFVFTMQGDGDMINEGLAEIMHAAARGENITCLLLNNGVFGDTGGQMTAGTVIGQRSTSTLEGRNAEQHGYPIPLSRILATMDGVGFVARTRVNDAAGVSRTKRLLKRAFEYQLDGKGFSLEEILTMCPTGWVTSAPDGPSYLDQTLGHESEFGVLRDTWAAPADAAESE